MKIARNDRGLTLIEIMVSVAVLMILLLGVGATLTTSIRANTYNQEKHLAERLGQGLMEKIFDFAAQGAGNFAILEANNFQGSMPGSQAAITAVRPAIPAEGATDRIYDDFDGDGVADYGSGIGGSKNIFVYQLLIDDIQVGASTNLLKQVTIRIYYADQVAGNPGVDLRKHPNPGGNMPRRFGSPLAEITTFISMP